MKFAPIVKTVYYKFEVHNKETNEYRMFQNHKKLQEYIDVPRSSMYKIMNGRIIPKWSNYSFKQIRVPIRDLRK
tara:strand:+ start:2729 stop:2950 length:222 start_codon:yes stop_codon:yes gene_type:complete